MSTEKEQNAENVKNNPQPNPPGRPNEEPIEIIPATQHSPDKDKKFKVLFREKVSLTDFIQICLLIVNIIMVASFITISCEQRSDTKKSLTLTQQSLNLSDSTTEQSLGLTQHSLAISESSLVISQKALEVSKLSTTLSLALAESSLVMSQKTFKLNETSMVVTNTPYIQILPSVGEIQETYFGYILKFRNVGNTPAIMIEGKIYSEIAEKTQPDNLNAQAEIFRIGNLLPKDSVFFHTDTVRIASKESFRNMFLKTHALKLYGYAEYRDIFGYFYRIDFSFAYDAEWDTFSLLNKGNDYTRIDKRSN